MHFTVHRDNIIQALDLCHRVTDARSPLPILGNVRLSASGDLLQLTASNLYRSAITVSDAEITETGDVCVDARKLNQLIRSGITGDRVAIKTDGDTLTLRAGKRRFTLHTIPGEEYPSTPSCTDGLTDVDAAALLTAIDTVSYATSGDTTRLHLNSLLIHERDGKHYAVATDGHRLAVVETPVQIPEQVLIPQAAVSDIRRMLDGAETVQISVQQPNLFVTRDGNSFSCKLTDAQFPPYMQVIPKSSDHAVTLTTDELRQAVQSVALMSSKNTQGIRLDFTAGSLGISTESPDTGVGSDSIDIEYGGPDITIGVHSGYLVEAIKPCGETVTLSFTGELDPIVVSSESTPGYVAVVMPLRI